MGCSSSVCLFCCGFLNGCDPEGWIQHVLVATRAVKWAVFWGFLKMGVPKVGGGLYCKSHKNGWFRGTPILGNLQNIYIYIYLVEGNQWISRHYNYTIFPFGGFLKWGDLQIIHFNRIFHYKPSTYWDFPIYGHPTTPGGATQSSIEGVFQRGRWEWHPTSWNALVVTFEVCSSRKIWYQIKHI